MESESQAMELNHSINTDLVHNIKVEGDTQVATNTGWPPLSDSNYFTGFQTYLSGNNRMETNSLSMNPYNWPAFAGRTYPYFNFTQTAHSMQEAIPSGAGVNEQLSGYDTGSEVAGERNTITSDRPTGLLPIKQEPSFVQDDWESGLYDQESEKSSAAMQPATDHMACPVAIKAEPQDLHFKELKVEIVNKADRFKVDVQAEKNKEVNQADQLEIKLEDLQAEDAEEGEIRPVGFFHNMTADADTLPVKTQLFSALPYPLEDQMPDNNVLNSVYPQTSRMAPKGPTEERPHVCEHCLASFTQKVYLKRHLKTHSGIKPWKCEQCGKDFVRRSQLQVHERSHSGEKPYKCSHCDASFAQSGHLQVHTRTHTGEKPFQCEDCDATFTSSSHLRTHMRCVHSNHRPFECVVCKMTFGSPANLRIHCRTHSGEKPYKCDHCDAAFTQSCNLKQHLLRHEGPKPHSCRFCGMKFARVGMLQRHFKVHEHENPFPCPDCDAEFPKLATLQSHVRTVHGKGQIYHCHVCSAKFNQSCNLKRHLLTHSGVKPFNCPQCDAAFSQLSHLKRHLLRLHKLESSALHLHRCFECNAAFKRKPELRRHRKMHIVTSATPADWTGNKSSDESEMLLPVTTLSGPLESSNSSSDSAPCDEEVSMGSENI